MATCSKNKGVLLTLYVERPRRILPNNHHHHHHDHDHGGKRYVHRRAELLQYSHHLRQSAARQPTLAAPLNKLQTSSSNQQPKTQAVIIRRKPQDDKDPICLGNCNFFGHFKRFQSKKRNGKFTSNTLKDVMKRLQLKKQKGFISKLFSSLRINRGRRCMEQPVGGFWW